MKKSYLYITITGILSGAIVFGAKVFSDMGLSLFQIAIFPLLFSVPILLPYLIYKRKTIFDKKMLPTYIGFGFVGAGMFLLEFAPVILGVPVAVAVLLLYTQPFWTTIFGKIFLNEKITRKKVLALLLALVGMIVLINPMAVKDYGSVTGVILAVLSGVVFSGWVIFGRIAGEKKNPPVVTKFNQSIFTLAFIAITVPIVAQFTNDPKIVDLSFNIPLEFWLYLLLYQVFFSIIPHLFFFEGSKEVPASEAGIILLLEPIFGAILAAIFLNQPLTTSIIIGGIIILIANYLIIQKSKIPQVPAEV